MATLRARWGFPTLAVLVGLLLISLAAILYHARKAIVSRPRPDVVALLNDLSVRANSIEPGETGSEGALARAAEIATLRLSKGRPGTPIADLTKAINSGHATREQEQEFSALIIDLDRTSFWSDLDQIAEHPAAKMPEFRHPIADGHQPGLGPSVSIGRVCTSMMVAAWRRADWPVVDASFRRVMGLAQFWTRQPLAITRTYGVALFTHATRELRYELVASRPPEPVLAQLQKQIEAFDLPPVSHAIAGERLITIDNFRVACERAAATDFHAGIHEPELDKYCQAVVKSSDDPDGRPPNGDRITDKTARELAAALIHTVDKTRSSQETALLAKAGTATMLAIERFAARTHALPASLKDLVPDFLDTLPVERWANTPIVYKPTDASTYVCYGFGFDHQDNQGRLASPPETAVTNKGAGFDWVFNARRQPTASPEPTGPDELTPH